MRFCKTLVLALTALIASCATYPTTDIKLGHITAEQSEDVIQSIGRLLKKHKFQDLDTGQLWQRKEENNGVILVSISSNSQGQIENIRLISRGASETTLNSMGTNLKRLVSDIAPDVPIEYKHFDQTDWFS